jgi:hypothetical protein
MFSSEVYIERDLWNGQDKAVGPYIRSSRKVFSGSLSDDGWLVALH